MVSRSEFVLIKITKKSFKNVIERNFALLHVYLEAQFSKKHYENFNRISDIKKLAFVKIVFLVQKIFTVKI